MYYGGHRVCGTIILSYWSVYVLWRAQSVCKQHYLDPVHTLTQAINGVAYDDTL